MIKRKSSKIAYIIIIAYIVCVLTILFFLKPKYPISLVESFNDGHYYILCRKVDSTTNIIINGEIFRSKEYYVLVINDISTTNLVDYVKLYKETKNKLYIIGVDPNTELDNSKSKTYSYFILDYDSGKLEKFNELEEMSEYAQNIFKKM